MIDYDHSPKEASVDKYVMYILYTVATQKEYLSLLSFRILINM